MTEHRTDHDRPAPEGRRLQVDQFLPRPPAAVWRALTDPQLLARWWAPGDIEPTVGHRFTMDMGGWGHAACTVLEAEPPTRLVYSFTDDWTLTWELTAEGHGTRLVLTHAGFDLDDPAHRFAFDTMGPGWRDEVLPRLRDLLAEPAARAPQ